jgi:hypothetical protein
MNTTTPGGLLHPNFGTDPSDAGGSSNSSPHDSALLLVLALLPFAGRLLGDYAFHALERRLFPEVRVLPPPCAAAHRARPPEPSAPQPGCSGNMTAGCLFVYCLTLIIGMMRGAPGRR